MIDLQALPGRTGGAVAALLLQNFRDIVGGETSAVHSLSCAAIVCASPRKLPFSFRILFAPSSVNNGSLFEIIGSPFLHAIAMTGRVFGATLARPLGLKARTLCMPSLAACESTFDTNAIRDKAQIVPMFAWMAAVMDKTRDATGGARGMFAPLLLAPNSVCRGADRANAGLRISLHHMPVFAGLARKVKSFTSNFCGLALRHSIHLNPHPASTMFIVAQAA